MCMYCADGIKNLVALAVFDLLLVHCSALHVLCVMQVLGKTCICCGDGINNLMALAEALCWQELFVCYAGLGQDMHVLWRWHQ